MSGTVETNCLVLTDEDNPTERIVMRFVNGEFQTIKQTITEVTIFEMRLVANTQIMMETSRKCTGILNMRF